MRIAQVAPLWQDVSTSSAGAVEHTIALLTEELIRRGHHVTLFASGDSETSAALVPVCRERLSAAGAPRRQHFIAMMGLLALEYAFGRATEFDIIHVHTDFMAFPLLRRSPLPAVATVYALVDSPEVLRVYDEFPDLFLVAVSAEQVRVRPALNWSATMAATVVDGITAQNLAEQYLAVYRRIVGSGRSLPAASTGQGGADSVTGCRSHVPDDAGEAAAAMPVMDGALSIRKPQ